MQTAKLIVLAAGVASIVSASDEVPVQNGDSSEVQELALTDTSFVAPTLGAKQPDKSRSLRAVASVNANIAVEKATTSFEALPQTWRRTVSKFVEEYGSRNSPFAAKNLSPADKKRVQKHIEEVLKRRKNKIRMQAAAYLGEKIDAKQVLIKVDHDFRTLSEEEKKIVKRMARIVGTIRLKIMQCYMQRRTSHTTSTKLMPFRFGLGASTRQFREIVEKQFNELTKTEAYKYRDEDLFTCEIEVAMSPKNKILAQKEEDRIRRYNTMYEEDVKPTEKLLQGHPQQHHSPTGTYTESMLLEKYDVETSQQLLNLEAMGKSEDEIFSFLESRYFPPESLVVHPSSNDVGILHDDEKELRSRLMERLKDGRFPSDVDKELGAMNAKKGSLEATYADLYKRLYTIVTTNLDR